MRVRARFSCVRIGTYVFRVVDQVHNLETDTRINRARGAKCGLPDQPKIAAEQVAANAPGHKHHRVRHGANQLFNLAAEREEHKQVKEDIWVRMRHVRTMPECTNWVSMRTYDCRHKAVGLIGIARIR